MFPYIQPALHIAFVPVRFWNQRMEHTEPTELMPFSMNLKQTSSEPEGDEDSAVRWRPTCKYN